MVRAGGVAIGGDHPIVVQSMIKVDPHDGPAILAQVERLAGAGCELCRLAVRDQAAVDTFAWVAGRAPLPLVADVHFDHQLALGAVAAGAAKLRINPGNLGGPEPLRLVAREATQAGIPIRVGVNLGSLEDDLARRLGHTAEAMAASAMRQVRLLEDTGFAAIVISAKASDVPRTVGAYRLIADETDWPLHLGITEAGPGRGGLVKSAAGLSILLGEGLGDTIRVSLTGDPAEEVAAAYEILRSLGLRHRGVELIACPTCGRCRFDLVSLAAEVNRRTANVTEPLVVAVMGCEVNGPGEARRADVGVALAGGGRAVLFAGGEVARTVNAAEAADELCAEIQRVLDRRRQEAK